MESNTRDNDVAQKRERTSRSITRTRGRPKKSPSRLSPSRKSPGRQSPSRRSPGRRSPGRSPASRSRKLTTRNLRIAQISIPSTELPKDEVRVEGSKTDVESLKDIDDITELIPLQSRIKEPGSNVTRRSTRILSNMMKTERDQRLIMLTRSVDRAASLPVDRRAHMFDFASEQKERGLSMQRDRDVSKLLHYEEEAIPDSSTTIEKSKKEIEFISKPQEWGGWFGALCLIFVLPIAIVLPQIACFHNLCKIEHFRISTKWESYLDINVIGLYAGFLVALTLLSVLPIGKLLDGQQNKIGRLQYRINGLLTATLVIVVFSVFEYNDYKIGDFILNSCLQLSIAGWMIGTILAIGLYLKANKASISTLNVYASTNNVIYDFWQGREVNPRIGKLDIKLLMLRASLIGTLLINTALVKQSVQDTDNVTIENINFTVLISSALQILYSFDSLLFEEASLTSFKIMYEGTGYMVCVGNLLCPFLTTLGTRYLLYQKINQSAYVLAAVVILFLVGYSVYRISNTQKDHYRRNPFSTAFSHWETIPTTRGKRLICSGLWGHVRHPNYLGDIIMSWSSALIALTKDVLPYYAAVCCTLALMYRAIRDGARCRNRYGSAWEQYCLRVKSMIMKRVF